MKNLFRAFAGIFGATMILSSCGGGGGSNRDSGDLGPTSSQSFAGTSISFNPTISFLPGGRVEWINTNPSSSLIKAPATEPLEGTYSYDPATNYRSGFLTINLNGEDPIFINVEKFVTENGFVQSFSVELYGDVFTARVVSGSLFAAEREGVEGVNDRPNNNSGFTFQENGNLTIGTNFARIFLAGNEQGDVSLSPLIEYSPGQPVNFEIIGDGSLVFEGETDTLTLFFLSATDDGIITYRADNVNGGRLTATLNTGIIEGSSDFAMVWSRTFFVNTLITNVAVDSKVFAK